MTDHRRMMGFLFIACGALWVVAIAVGLGAAGVVPIIGVGFLIAHFVTGRPGLLIPGCIVFGLGAGLVVAALGGPADAVVMGLGVGFLLIAVLDALFGRSAAVWWPLIPGGILTVIGVAQILGVRDAGRFVLPASLVVVGMMLLIRPSVRRAAAGADARVEAGDGGEGSVSVAAPTEPQQGDRQ